MKKTPRRAPVQVATSRAAGVARPRAHGQAMISTEIDALSAAAAVLPVATQIKQRAERDRQHGGHEHGADAVGQSLHGRLLVLRVLDQAQHLAQLSVGADPAGPHHEAAAQRDGAAEHGVAGTHVLRLGLARHHAAVHR